MCYLLPAYIAFSFFQYFEFRTYVGSSILFWIKYKEVNKMIVVLICHFFSVLIKWVLNTVNIKTFVFVAFFLWIQNIYTWYMSSCIWLHMLTLRWNRSTSTQRLWRYTLKVMVRHPGRSRWFKCTEIENHSIIQLISQLWRFCFPYK